MKIIIEHPLDELYKIAAGILAVIAIWWKAKSNKEKKHTAEDAVSIVSDGKVTLAEATNFTDEHIINK